MQPAKVWVRNAAIGACLVSYKALFWTVGDLLGGSSEFPSTAGITVVLVAGGILAGLLFTALYPLRKRGEFGRYLGWVLSAYVVLASVVVMAISAGDETAVGILTEPWGLVLLVVGGALAGILAARTVED